MGTYTEMAGSTDISACLPAPKGNYAPGTGNDGFIPCEGGTYQDEEGQGACKPCPPGNQCPAGSVAPTKCPPGFYADSRQPWCKECAKGTYQNTEGQRACKPCPAGSYCQATKMVTPTACPAGKYGIKFSAISPTDCAACPINVSGPVSRPRALLGGAAELAWCCNCLALSPCNLPVSRQLCVTSPAEPACCPSFPSRCSLSPALLAKPSAPSAAPACGPHARRARSCAGTTPRRCRPQDDQGRGLAASAPLPERSRTPFPFSSRCTADFLLA